jgi:putative acetyltransferase
VGGLGFVGSTFEFCAHNASIGMSIQQEFTNSGPGQAMLAYALETGKENGFHRVDHSVRTHNHAGIALYERLGFARVGLLKDTAFIDREYVSEYAYQRIL